MVDGYESAADGSVQSAGGRPPVVAPRRAVPEAAGTEYVVVNGDSLAKIAKKNGVTLKALEAANPGVEPTKLKVGQKLTIPASGGAAAPAATARPASTGSGAGGETYTVKSGDTLTKIAKAHGTTVKAIEAENNLTTTKIKVGQKLKIPAKAEAAAPARRLRSRLRPRRRRARRPRQPARLPVNKRRIDSGWSRFAGF